MPYSRIMNQESRIKSKGFTLIELLVVIAIIGVLSSIVMASLNTARAKSRDAKRIVDLKQLQVALEFYFNDNREYPSTSNSYFGDGPSYGNKTTSGPDGWIPNLAPDYISVLPLDPRPIGNIGRYVYRSADGKNYKISAKKTVEECPVPSTHSLYDPFRSPTECTISIFTPGGASY